VQFKVKSHNYDIMGNMHRLPGTNEYIPPLYKLETEEYFLIEIDIPGVMVESLKSKFVSIDYMYYLNITGEREEPASIQKEKSNPSFNPQDKVSKDNFYYGKIDKLIKICPTDQPIVLGKPKYDSYENGVVRFIVKKADMN